MVVAPSLDRPFAQRAQRLANQVHNAVVKCSAFGGKQDVIEVADSGGWSHAYQEHSVEPNATYTISGERAIPLSDFAHAPIAKWPRPLLRGRDVEGCMLAHLERSAGEFYSLRIGECDGTPKVWL